MFRQIADLQRVLGDEKTGGVDFQPRSFRRKEVTTKTLENGEGKDYGKARELVPESRGNRLL